MAEHQQKTEKGVANGYASLDAGGLVPLAQLPALGGTPGATPTQIDIGDSQVGGVDLTYSRNDHQHANPAPSVGYPVDVALSEADGTSATPARADHRHAHGSGYDGGHTDSGALSFSRTFAFMGG